MGLNVYRKIAKSGHTFEPVMFYSFADEARLMNTSSMCVRQQAIYDQWPTVSVHVSKGQAKRLRYINGSYLEKIQIAARDWHKSRTVERAA